MSIKNTDCIGTVEINSIFEDPRDSVFDEEKICSNIIDFQRPEICIKIQDIKVNILIDTGSKISCVSENFYKKHKNNFIKCPTIPLPNIQATGFDRKKSDKLKIQIHPEFTFEKIAKNINIIIVPNLIRDCIIGIYALVKLGTIINLKDNVINISQATASENIKFTYSNQLSEDICTINNYTICLTQSIRLKSWKMINRQTMYQQNRT